MELIEASIKKGWHLFKQRAWFFVGITLLTLFLGWLIGFASGSFNAVLGNNIVGNATGFAIKTLGQMLLGMGTVAFFLKSHDTHMAHAWDLWHPQPLWYYTGAVLLYGVLVVLGCIMLIIPGIIAALMFFFSQYIVIDKELAPIAALKESYRITHGHLWQMLGLLFILTLINIVGAICLFVGLLVSIPVTSLAIVHAYRTLSRTTA